MDGLLSRVTFLLFILCCSFWNSAFASEKVTHHLVNNYDVYLVDLQSGNSFGYVYAVPYGSADDEPRVMGRAHLFEHIMGRGSVKYPGHETLIEKMTQLGYQRNAGTGSDITNYYAFGNEDNAMTAMDYGLSPLFGIEADPSSYARELKTVINEVVDTAPQRPERAIFALRFAVGLPEGHALQGHHVGTMKTLTEMTREDLFELHQKIYRPGIVKVAILGNFTSGKWSREQVLEKLKTSLPQNFERQNFPTGKPMNLFGLKQGPQILEIEGGKKSVGLMTFNLASEDERQNVEVFLETFSLSYRGGIRDYLTLNKGWITSLDGWTDRHGNAQVANLMFGLTDEGYKNRDTVTSVILSAMKTFRKEKVSEAVMQSMRDTMTASLVVGERDIQTMIRSMPGWLTTPHLTALAQMDWNAAVAVNTPDNVLKGANAIDFDQLGITFQIAEKVESQGVDGVFKLNFARRHLSALSQFPVGVAVRPSQIVVPQAKISLKPKSGLQLSRMKWQQTNGWTIAHDNLDQWVSRSAQMTLEFDRLTALEELSLQALLEGFKAEHVPELLALHAQGVDINIFPGNGTLTMAGQSKDRNLLSAFEWLDQNLHAYVFSPEALARFVEKKQKELRSRELNFPANISNNRAATILSSRGIGAIQIEKALPDLTVELVRSVLTSEKFKRANKMLIFAGVFFSSEVDALKTVAKHIAPLELDHGDVVIGDRLAVSEENLTYFEPWLSSESTGVGSSRLFKSPPPSKMIEYTALAVVREILHDKVFLTNRPYGYVQGAGRAAHSKLDHHMMFYGQANNMDDMNQVHAGWDAALAYWRENKVTDEEIEKAKAGLLASLKEQPSSSSEGVSNMASGVMSYNHPFYSRIMTGIVPSLSPDEVRSVAIKYLGANAGQLTVIKGTVNACEDWLTSLPELRERLKR